MHLPPSLLAIHSTYLLHQKMHLWQGQQQRQWRQQAALRAMGASAWCAGSASGALSWCRVATESFAGEVEEPTACLGGLKWGWAGVWCGELWVLVGWSS